MKILFAINSLEKGGAERVGANLCNYLVEKNDVSIITLENKEIQYDINKKIDILYAVDHQVYSKNRIIRVLKKIRITIKQVFSIRKYIKQIKPDIIVSFLPGMSLRILAANNTNIPIIVSVRNDPKIEYASKGYCYLMKKLYPKAKGFIFQTEEAKEYFSKEIVKDSTIIPNPINENFIVEPYKGERNKEIVTVGRLEEQKNQKMLIEAFSKIADEFKEYKLMIYGEGSLRNQLQEQINQKALSERIVLAGQINDVKDKIYNSALFVLCSKYEGMPNALMEAMALGLPVISTDCPCGGPRFLIKNEENGILIKNENIDELSSAIKHVLSNTELANKISVNANKISESLNPKVINEQFEKYIIKIKGE